MILFVVFAIYRYVLQTMEIYIRVLDGRDMYLEI